MKKPIITGARGKWTAEYNGQTFPVIHNFRLTRSSDANGKMKAHYDDDFEHGKHGKPAADWAAAFDNPEQWVIVQRGAKDSAGKETRERNGYVGVFKFANLDLKSGFGCKLELTERIA